MDINFTFSDTITGYVTNFNLKERWFTVVTSDEKKFKIHLTDNSYARFVRNLGEPYQDATGKMNHLLALQRQMVFAYGTFYP
ncbi:MAG: N-acyl-D-glucosamine 2-epimerase, partial [Prolixibacteraceae bacterium]|nr:N-acyl-D-glucosamine 2-epimerase [Prolixibacteraceae bacterium]